jgi:hypothetical protein
MDKSLSGRTIGDSKDSESQPAPPPYEAPSSLEEASAIGCLPQVQELYIELETTWGRLPAFQKSVESTIDASMRNAVRHNNPEVISYFLDRGYPITHAVGAAVSESGTTDIFEMLLDHGWDINSRIWSGRTSLM